MNTVEGATVLTAIAVTVGLLLAGLGTVATNMAAHSSARDAARLVALGVAEADIPRREGERIAISRQPVAGTPWSMVSVTLTKKAPLFSITVTESILEEPNAHGSGG